MPTPALGVAVNVGPADPKDHVVVGLSASMVKVRVMRLIAKVTVVAVASAYNGDSVIAAPMVQSPRLTNANWPVALSMVQTLGVDEVNAKVPEYVPLLSVAVTTGAKALSS